MQRPSNRTPLSLPSTLHHRPSTTATASPLRASLCLASASCIFCTLYFGSSSPTCPTQLASVQTPSSLSPTPTFAFLSTPPLPLSFPLSYPPSPPPLPPNADQLTILNNRHTGSLGCAPTPSQYFARDVSSLMSLNGLPSPSGAGLGIGS